MNNVVFGKNMENMRQHRNNKLVTTERRRNYLVSENISAIEMGKTQILMNKPVCLGLSILDLSKTGMYEIWFDRIKSKYDEKAKLCYTGAGSFIVHVKTEDIYRDIAEDVEKDLTLQILN